MRHEMIRARWIRVFRLLPAVALSSMLSACGNVGLTATSPGPRHPLDTGVNSDLTWGIPGADIRTEVKMIKAARLGWVRASVDLSGAEYQRPGRLNRPYIRQVDAGVLAARAAKLNVLLQLDRTPYWASADPSKHRDARGVLHWNHYWAYERPQDYARIAADVARHYARMGVHAYEIWSEPNYRPFWPSGVNAAAYVRLLRLGRRAIKAVDRKAVIVMGGLSPTSVYSYLAALYRAHGGGLWDVANFHLYPNGSPTRCLTDSHGVPRGQEVCALRSLASQMAAQGDRSPVWITELGWSTCINRPPCVTQQQQASYLSTAVRMLSTHPYAFVKTAFVYQMRDLTSRRGDVTWGGSLGIVSRTLVPKLAYAAVSKTAAAVAGRPAHHSQKRDGAKNATAASSAGG